VFAVPREVVRVTASCTACGACLVTCPERALRRAAKRPLVVEAACTACWACIEICPAGAIEAVWVLAAGREG
jgi:Fe-S-cluster-containing hydrogenase component 2